MQMLSCHGCLAGFPLLERSAVWLNAKKNEDTFRTCIAREGESEKANLQRTWSPYASLLAHFLGEITLVGSDGEWIINPKKILTTFHVAIRFENRTWTLGLSVFLSVILVIVALPSEKLSGNVESASKQCYVDFSEVLLWNAWKSKLKCPFCHKYHGFDSNHAFLWRLKIFCLITFNLQL